MSIERTADGSALSKWTEPPTLGEALHTGPFTYYGVEVYGRFREARDPSVSALETILGGGLDVLASLTTHSSPGTQLLRNTNDRIRFGFHKSGKQERALDAAAAVVRPTGRKMQPADHLLALTVCPLEEDGVFAVDARYVGMRQPTTPEMVEAKRTQRGMSPHFQTALALSGYYLHGDHQHPESALPYPHEVVAQTLERIKKEGIHIDITSSDSIAQAREALGEAVRAYCAPQ